MADTNRVPRNNIPGSYRDKPEHRRARHSPEDSRGWSHCFPTRQSPRLCPPRRRRRTLPIRRNDDRPLHRRQSRQARRRSPRPLRHRHAISRSFPAPSAGHRKHSVHQWLVAGHNRAAVHSPEGAGVSGRRHSPGAGPVRAVGPGPGYSLAVGHHNPVAGRHNPVAAHSPVAGIRAPAAGSAHSRRPNPAPWWPP